MAKGNSILSQLQADRRPACDLFKKDSKYQVNIEGPEFLEELRQDNCALLRAVAESGSFSKIPQGIREQLIKEDYLKTSQLGVTILACILCPQIHPAHVIPDITSIPEKIRYSFTLAELKILRSGAVVHRKNPHPQVPLHRDDYSPYDMILLKILWNFFAPEIREAIQWQELFEGMRGLGGDRPINQVFRHKNGLDVLPENLRAGLYAYVQAEREQFAYIYWICCLALNNNLYQVPPKIWNFLISQETQEKITEGSQLLNGCDILQYAGQTNQLVDIFKPENFVGQMKKLKEWWGLVPEQYKNQVDFDELYTQTLAVTLKLARIKNQQTQ